MFLVVQILVIYGEDERGAHLRGLLLLPVDPSEAVSLENREIILRRADTQTSSALSLLLDVPLVSRA